MAVTASPYAGFLLGLGRAEFDLFGDTIKVALASGSYQPNMTADMVLADVNGLVATADAQTVTGVSLTYSPTTFLVTASSDDVVWPAASFTAHYAVIYKDLGSAATSRLIGYVNFGSDRVYDNEDFTLSFSEGFVQIPAV